jgi:hypothetical protein
VALRRRETSSGLRVSGFKVVVAILAIGAGTKETFAVLSLVAAAALAATASPPPLQVSAPWWERIVKTLDSEGTELSCKYESSISPAPTADGCAAPASASSEKAASGAAAFRKLTFERRFSPHGRPDSGVVEKGDTLLSQRVLYLAIDASGKVQDCRVVSTSGEMALEYGCDEARSEKFAAGAHGAARQAFMTVRVYGHTEQIA